jgi:hypothetical protein
VIRGRRRIRAGAGRAAPGVVLFVGDVVAQAGAPAGPKGRGCDEPGLGRLDPAPGAAVRGAEGGRTGRTTGPPRRGVKAGLPAAAR